MICINLREHSGSLYIYMYIYIYLYIYICVCVCVCVCEGSLYNVYPYGCLHLMRHTPTHSCKHYTPLHIYIYIYIYTYEL